MKPEIIIRDYFKNLGYTKVKVNNWEGKRIYVDFPEGITFSYDLSKDYKVSSKDYLDKKLFKHAVKAAYRVKSMEKT